MLAVAEVAAIGAVAERTAAALSQFEDLGAAALSQCAAQAIGVGPIAATAIAATVSVRRRSGPLRSEPLQPGPTAAAATTPTATTFSPADTVRTERRGAVRDSGGAGDGSPQPPVPVMPGRSSWQAAAPNSTIVFIAAHLERPRHASVMIPATGSRPERFGAQCREPLAPKFHPGTIHLAGGGFGVPDASYFGSLGQKCVGHDLRLSFLALLLAERPIVIRDRVQLAIKARDDSLGSQYPKKKPNEIHRDG